MGNGQRISQAAKRHYQEISMNDNEIIDPKEALELVVQWWKSASWSEREEFLNRIGASVITSCEWMVPLYD
jgi:hypothetical protein